MVVGNCQGYGNGTYYVPTISAGEFVAEKAKIDNYFPEIVRPKAANVGPQIGKTFNKAFKKGVKIIDANKVSTKSIKEAIANVAVTDETIFH